MSKKSFKEKTGIGKFLAKLAPNVLDIVGIGFPPAKLLSDAIKGDKQMTADNKLEAEKLLKHYEEVELVEHYKDVRDARHHDIKIQESPFAAKIAKVGPYIIDFIIIGATVLLAALLFAFRIPIENKEIAYMAFGSLFTLSTTIIGFHRGTSQSSKDKNKIFETLADKI